MWMDADDILEEKEKDKFLQLKQTLSSDIDFVMMKYHTSFDEAGKPSFSYFRERWIRNCPQYRWVGAVHEVIPPAGNVVYSDIAVSHKKINAGDPDRNLNIYRKLLAEEKVWIRGSSITLAGSCIIISNTKRLFQCWNDFCSRRKDGSRIR